MSDKIYGRSPMQDIVELQAYFNGLPPEQRMRARAASVEERMSVAPDPMYRPFDVEVLIGAEFYELLQRFGAQSDLLGVIGSWGEGDLSSEEVLVYLRAYNGADREERADVGRRLAASRTIHPNSAV